MSKVITAEARITASDKTGAVFDKLASKFKGLEKNAKALEGIKPVKFSGYLFEELKRLQLTEKQLQGVRKEMALFQSQLKAAGPMKMEHYLRSIGDWKNKTVQHWREVRVAAEEAQAAQKMFASGSPKFLPFARSALGVIGGAYAGYRAARFAYEKTSDDNRETTKQRQAGLTQSQSDDIAAEADRQSQNFPSVSQTEFRSAGREATMQLGSAAAGLKMMPTLGGFMTTGKVIWGADKIGEATRKAMQGADLRGITDPDRMEKWLDAITRAGQIEGGQDFDPGGLREALKYGRTALKGQSDRFLTTVVPPMGVDMGYSQVGTGIASMHSGLIGGRQTKEASQFQAEAGLREKNRLVGADLFQRDLDRWFDKFYIPALQKKGVDVNDPAAVGEFNSKFFSNRTAADVASNYVNQRSQYQRRGEQYDSAKGTIVARNLHREDLGLAAEAASAQLGNVATALDKVTGASGKMISSMNSVAEGAGSFSTWLRTGKWPQESIDKWKQHLDSGAYNDFGGMLKDDFDRKRALATLPDWTRSATVNQKSGDVWADAPAGIAPTAPGPRWGMMPHTMRKPMAAPEVSQTMTYGTGAGGGGGDRNISVTGEISGEAQVKVLVEAGSSLIEAKQQAEAAMKLAGKLARAYGNLNANGPGSIGRSSPDAAAPPPIYSGDMH